MNSNAALPAAAGILMLVLGLAIAGGLGKGILMTLRRRGWTQVEGRVQIVTDRAGGAKSVALVHYPGPQNEHLTLETPTGAMSSSALHNKVVPVQFDPDDPKNASVKTANSSLFALGMFALISVFFAVFGLFTIIYVFTR